MLLSHLSYEEYELVEPLARVGSRPVRSERGEPVPSSKAGRLPDRRAWQPRRGWPTTRTDDLWTPG